MKLVRLVGDAASSITTRSPASNWIYGSKLSKLKRSWVWSSWINQCYGRGWPRSVTSMVLVTLNNLERLITWQPLFFLMQPLHWWLGRRTKDATLSQGQMIGACSGTVSSRPDKLWRMNYEKPWYSPIIICLKDVKTTNPALITPLYRAQEIQCCFQSTSCWPHMYLCMLCRYWEKNNGSWVFFLGHVCCTRILSSQTWIADLFGSSIGWCTLHCILGGCQHRTVARTSGSLRDFELKSIDYHTKRQSHSWTLMRISYVNSQKADYNMTTIFCFWHTEGRINDLPDTMPLTVSNSLVSPFIMNQAFSVRLLNALPNLIHKLHHHWLRLTRISGPINACCRRPRQNVANEKGESEKMSWNISLTMNTTLL